MSTLSLTQRNDASFLAAQGRPTKREWAERILRKKGMMPDYIRRREREWFREARGFMKSLSQSARIYVSTGRPALRGPTAPALWRGRQAVCGINGGFSFAAAR